MVHAGDLGQVLPTDKVDVATAVSYVSSSPDWWKTCLLAGLFAFLPVVGFVALMGWARDIHDSVRAGRPDVLPPLAFSTHLERGWRPVGGMVFTLMTLYVVLGVPVLGALGIGGVLANALGDVGEVLALVALLFSLLLFLLMVFAYAAYRGEMDRLAFEGELFPLAHLRQSVRAVRASPGAYLTTVAGLFLSSMLAGSGSALCFVFGAFTLPVGWALAAHLTGQWARVVDHAPGVEA
jgi:hypothetical protein